MRMHPGDTFEAEVTRVGKITSGSQHVQQCYRMVTAMFDVPGRVKPYFACMSWNMTTCGLCPSIGDTVQVVFIEPPFAHLNRNYGAGKFRITGIISKEEDEMSMSYDRVKFYIGPKYFQYSKFYDVLEKAFGLGEAESRRMYRKAHDGFTITCRPSQFARFMIYRNEAEIQNGFMDLRPELIEPQEEKSPYRVLAEATGVSFGQVRKLADLMGVTYDDIMSRVAVNYPSSKRAWEFDVSGNPHRR